MVVCALNDCIEIGVVELAPVDVIGQGDNVAGIKAPGVVKCINEPGLDILAIPGALIASDKEMAGDHVVGHLVLGIISDVLNSIPLCVDESKDGVNSVVDPGEIADGPDFVANIEIFDIIEGCANCAGEGFPVEGVPAIGKRLDACNGMPAEGARGGGAVESYTFPVNVDRGGNIDPGVDIDKPIFVC